VTTRRFAVIGDPVAHSASPRMHQAAYAALGLDCTYEAIRATDADLPALIDRLHRGELDGLNVTIPHKRRILPFADIVDSSARVVGAANTLVRAPNGRIVAHNTDVHAIAAELQALAHDVPAAQWKKARTLVLGTGATACSAVVALGCHLGVAQITVRGRALEDEMKKGAFEAALTELLLRAGSTSALRFEPWAPIVTTDQEVLAIVQATNVGMAGADPGEVAAEAVAWHMVFPESVALDVVYARATTPFLEAARAHGMRIADGRGMLARQGALAFSLWFRRAAPFDVMRAAIGD
jgi:shikimate dehydrogenase